MFVSICFVTFKQSHWHRRRWRLIFFLDPHATMRRSNTTDLSPEDQGQGQPKKTKALLACDNCRRSKARCETSTGGSITSTSRTSCRRCSTLNKACSFTENALNDNAIPEPRAGPDTSPVHHLRTGLADSIENVQNMEVPWGTLHNGEFSYSEAPVLALELAVRSRPPEETSYTGGRASQITDVLTDADIRRLLEM